MSYRQKQPSNNYRKEKATVEDKKDYEIRIKKGKTERIYINRGAKLLLGSSEDKIEKVNFISIQAIDSAVPVALKTAFILRSKIPGLHQINIIQNRQITERYLPKEEGLEIIEKNRNLTIFEVILTYQPTEEQKNLPGYQDVDASVVAKEELKITDIIRERDNNNEDRPRRQNNRNFNRNNNRNNNNNRNYNRNSRNRSNDVRDNQDNNRNRNYRGNRNNEDRPQRKYSNNERRNYRNQRNNNRDNYDNDNYNNNRNNNNRQRNDSNRNNNRYRNNNNNRNNNRNSNRDNNRDSN